MRQYAGRPEGVIETTDFEGQRSLQAFHWSRLTGWRVATWAPLSLVEGQLRQAWTLFFWSGAALLSLSLLIAFGVGRLMAAPMAKLMHAGAALGEGKPVSPIASTLREADELSLVLSTAAKELDVRMGAQAHLAAIVTSSPSAVVSLSPAGIIRTWNAAATSLFGYEEAEVIGRPDGHTRSRWGGRGYRQAQCQRQSRHRRAARTRCCRHKDGRLIDVSVSVAPMYDDSRNLVGISAIISDIGERRARERHIEFLMREVSHRSKNLLAVVQAIAGQTARHSPSVEEFQARFSQRIAAMARSQDLLVEQQLDGRDRGRPGAHAAGTVRGSLVLAHRGRRDRAWSSSPTPCTASRWPCTSSPPTPPSTAPCPCPTAASPSTGRSSGAQTRRRQRFRMSWRESDGPPVTPPAKKGFGHVVISEMVGELAARTRHARLRAARACCGPSTRRGRACWATA